MYGSEPGSTQVAAEHLDTGKDEGAASAALPRCEDATSLAGFVTSSRSSVATLALAFMLAACAQEQPKSKGAQFAYRQAAAEYVDRSRSGAIQRFFAQELVMQRDHLRLCQINPNIPENWEQFRKEHYEPLQAFVANYLRHEHVAEDPVGAVKTALFEYLSPSIVYNKDYDNIFSPLDQQRPRGQCLSCTTLAAIVALDPEIDLKIPVEKTLVMVYTDSHVLLGLLDKDTHELVTHEFTTRGLGGVRWGVLERSNSELPRMAVASAYSVLHGVVIGERPPYLFHNLPESSNSPAMESAPNSLVSDPLKNHGQLGAFSSGGIQVPSGDRNFPTAPVRTLSYYQGINGVYGSDTDTRGSIADALNRENKAVPPSSPGLDERLANATRVLTPSEKRIFLDFFRFADPLYEIRNQSVDPLRVLQQHPSDQEARASVLRLSREFEAYWQAHHLDQHAARSLAARQKVVDAGWRVTDPVAIRANFKSWCASVGLEYAK